MSEQDDSYEPHHASSPPTTSSTSFNFMATVPSRTNPTEGRCPKETTSPAPSPISSTP